MVTNKLKSILALKGFSFADYARQLKIKPQSLQTKAKKDAYKIHDLIEFGELTGTRLAFVDENDKPVVVFDTSDLK